MEFTGLGFIGSRVSGFIGFRALMGFIGLRGSLVDLNMGHLGWGSSLLASTQLKATVRGLGLWV